MLLDAFILAAALQVTPQVLRYDVDDARYRSDGVTRVELQIDGGPRLEIALTRDVSQDGAEPGYTTYRTQFPALSMGSHTAIVYLCNPLGCAPSPSLSFVVGVLPGPAKNLRVGAGGLEANK